MLGLGGTFSQRTWVILGSMSHRWAGRCPGRVQGGGGATVTLEGSGGFESSPSGENEPALLSLGCSHFWFPFAIIRSPPPSGRQRRGQLLV